MDVTWFKKQQKKAGVTAQEIAEKMGRNRSIVSHIYAGRQKMSLEWARAFAEVLEVPLEEVIEHAGLASPTAARSTAMGFSEGDAEPFVGKASELDDNRRKADLFGGNKAGIDVWEVRTSALCLGGYLPGDRILVDTNQAERCRAGDIVIAQRYDAQRGDATTLLRRYEPPVLVAASAEPEEQRVVVVDGTNVVIRGKIIASWRNPKK